MLNAFLGHLLAAGRTRSSSRVTSRRCVTNAMLRILLLSLTLPTGTVKRHCNISLALCLAMYVVLTVSCSVNPS